MQNEKIVVDERDANSWPTVLEPNTNPGTILGLAPPPSVPPASGTPHGPRDLAGTELLARYEVEEVIGSGGMATVYRGRHKAIQKPVAIKVLDDGLEWRLDAAERFLQEAQVTSRVIHENVVEVTDFGTTADRVVFCVMELLQGESLADVIARTGAMSLPRAAEIMRQICSALEAAHGHGIIHRDLKPANVFCTPRPSNPDFVKVLDFGIARVAHDVDGPHDPEAARPMPTITGYIIGTPDYMAPEQACEQPLDHRVDVYAAGGVFFELLTGRKPYLGRSTAELLAAHLHLPVPDPGELDPSLPQAVRDVVRKAMAKDPDDRYASMREMSEAIADAVCAEDMLAIVRGPRRRMAIAAFAVGVLGLGGWLVSDPPSPPEATPMMVEPQVIEARAPVVPIVLPTPVELPAIETAAPPVVEAAAVVATPSVPRSAAPKRARKPVDREPVELPPVTPEEPPVPEETAPIADSEPLRSKISEVKDPFASDAAPPGDVAERSAADTSTPDVGVAD